MLWRAFRISIIGLRIVSIWLLLSLLLVLPRSAPEWIPFWAVVLVGLFFLARTARQFQHSPLLRRQRVLSAITAGAAILFGTLLVVGNEVQARRSGDWEGYLTVLGGVLSVHGLLHIILLRRTKS